MIKTFYCFRHGQTDWNKLKKLQGCDVDLSLNENGRMQALEIPYIDIDIIYTSPLKRASETAEIYNKRDNLEIIIYDALKELSFGDLAGETLEKLGTDYKGVLLGLIDNQVRENKISEFEEALKDIANSSDLKTFGIFTHGGVLYLIANKLVKRDPPVLKNSEFLEIEYNTETDELSLVEDDR